MIAINGSRIVALLIVAAGLPLSASALAQCGPAKGKISRNFYRIPYGNGEDILIGPGGGYVNHGGAYDMVGQNAGAESPSHTIVAAADGFIEGLDDSHNECGFHGYFCCCVNWIGIRHENGEISRYYHIRQGTATALGHAPGNFVLKGQLLGIEGDVGITGRTPGTSPPRTGPCAPPPLPDDYPDGVGCQLHLHFAVFRDTTGELLAPMTCNIPGNLYAEQIPYTVDNCSTPFFCIVGAQHFSGVTVDGLGDMRVYQNNQTITADTFVVQNQASTVFHAADRVRLLPGFRAGAGDSYFRAEIGDCNTTAAGGTGIAGATSCPPVSCQGGCP